MRVIATAALAVMTAFASMAASADNAEARRWHRHSGGAIAFGVASAIVAGIALSRYNRGYYYDDGYYGRDYYYPRRSYYSSYGYYSPRRYYAPRGYYGYYPRSRAYAYGSRHNRLSPNYGRHYGRHINHGRHHGHRQLTG